MSDFTARLMGSSGGSGFTARLLGGGGRSSGRRSLPELEAQVDRLEQTSRAYGAPGIDEDKPGLFGRVIDILSRSEYATAGITEELLNGRGVTSAISRAFNEVFSGIGPFEGQKIDFTQVLERQGVGTKTLADMFPALDGTWVGSFGSRGAAGLALSIAADPLTYITFGTGSAAKITTKGGARVVHLTKRGASKLDEFRRGFQGRFDDLLRQRDKLDIPSFTRKQGELKDEVDEAFLSALDAGQFGDDAVAVGGARFAGVHIPGTENIAPGVRKIVETMPGGARVLRGAGEFARGLEANFNRIFSPFGEAANLPKGVRERYIKLKRDFTTSRTVQAQRIHHLLSMGWYDDAGEELVAPGYMKRARAELTADENFGKKLADIIEETGEYRMADLSEAQQQVVKETRRIYDALGSTLVEAGILDPSDFRQGKYIYHVYKNADALAQFHANLGIDMRGMSEIRSSFRKERAFDTLKDSVEKSKELHENALRQVDAGKVAKNYPVLDPEYDFLKNLDTYIDRYSDSLARKAWQEQVLGEFGRKIDGEDLTVIYEVMKPIENLAQDDAKYLGQLAESLGDKPAKKLNEKQVAAFELLSDQGKREFIRQLIVKSKNSEEFAKVVKQLHKQEDLIEFFPAKRAINAGDAEKTLAKMFPEESKYRVVSNVFTNNEEYMLPEIIVRDVQNLNRKIINSDDNKAFQSMLRGFDRVNNLFKLGVYTFWPASIVRDGYSNIALSMLDIGLGAVNPKSHLDTIGIMAGRKGVMKTVGGVQYSWDNLREMAKDFGVWVPGEVFAELSGDPKVAGTAIRKLTNKRALIENEARVQLWLQNIRRGVDPRQAADHVRDFLFDYGELSSVEREIFRRFIPFYTFTRKNIALQVRTLKSKPGLAINQIKPFRKRDDEKEWMVKWEAEALGIRLNRDGKTVTMIQGIDLPLRNLDTLYAGGVGSTGRRLFGMITPILKVPLEAIAQRDFFTGGDLKRTRGDTVGRIIESTGTPKAIRDWIGYRKEYDSEGRPKYTFDGTRYALLVRSWAFSRLFSTSDRQFREYLGDQKILDSFVDILTGLRFKEMNMEDQQRLKLSRRVREIEEALTRRGVLEQTTIAYERKRRGRAPEF